MKILYIITGLGVGGAEIQLINIINNLSQKKIPPENIKVISLTTDIKIKPYDEIEINCLQLNKNPLSFMLAIRMAYKITKDFKPTVVHSHMFHANIFSRILRPFASIPFLINSAHSSNEGGWIRMTTYRLTDFLCDLTTNVSLMASQVFIEKKAFKDKKTLTVYNGIDTNKFQHSSSLRVSIRNEFKLDETDLLLTNVGRLVDVKDQSNLIRSFCIVKDMFPNSKLLIIGNGPLKEQLTKLAESLSVFKDIIFIVHTENISSYLSASDLFILSSKYEGFPLSLIEAMSCKCLCVSTDNGGQVEAFSKESNLLCSPQNAEKLASTITTVLSLPTTDKEKIITECYRRVLNTFNLSVVADKWFDIYIRDQHND